MPDRHRTLPLYPVRYVAIQLLNVIIEGRYQVMIAGGRRLARPSLTSEVTGLSPALRDTL
jgi:hypothetical protein